MATSLSRPWASLTALPLFPDFTSPIHGGRRYLFLLSHMRSYSSVLAHILGSSPDIDGYGETHIKYRHRFDLWRLRHRVQLSTGRTARRKFLLDKILHNYIASPDRLLAPERSRAIIFVRRPETTLRSIVALSQATGKHSPCRDPELACDYYVSRLHQLRKDGQRLGKHALYFDADLIVKHPRPLLSDIGRWLDLNTPLSSHYQTGRFTGTAGFGDPMPNIHAGRILDDASSTSSENIVLPTRLVSEANAAYERCRATLMSCCATL